MDNYFKNKENQSFGILVIQKKKQSYLKKIWFVDYGGHHENKMSLFYHTIYLPQKFNRIWGYIGYQFK